MTAICTEFAVPADGAPQPRHRQARQRAGATQRGVDLQMPISLLLFGPSAEALCTDWTKKEAVRDDNASHHATYEGALERDPDSI